MHVSSLDRALCQAAGELALRRYAQGASLEAVTSRDGRVDRAHRDARTLSDPDLFADLFEAMHAKTRELHGRDLQLVYREVVVYPVGGHIALHADNSVRDADGRYTVVRAARKVSTVAYLNEGFEGGELHFPMQNLTFAPATGRLVTFPSTPDYPHYTVPCQGVKAVAIAFYDEVTQ